VAAFPILKIASIKYSLTHTQKKTKAGLVKSHKFEKTKNNIYLILHVPVPVVLWSTVGGKVSKNDVIITNQ
jgi:hypothetical protein